jgi:hypothetical protein
MAQLVRTCIIRNELGITQTVKTLDTVLNSVAERASGMFECEAGKPIIQKTYGFNVTIDNQPDFYYFQAQPIVSIHKMTVDGETFKVSTAMGTNVAMIDRGTCNTAVYINEVFPTTRLSTYFSITAGYNCTNATTLSIGTAVSYSYNSKTFNVPAIIEQAVLLKTIEMMYDGQVGTSTTGVAYAKGYLLISERTTPDGAKFVINRSHIQDIWNKALLTYGTSGLIS